MNDSKINSRILFSLLAAILLTVLFFGLDSRDFRFYNNATWIGHEPGIRFGDYGIIYADLDERIKKGLAAAGEFSIEIALKPEVSDTGGFNLLFSLHAGDDYDQLIIGQWQSSIIVMNGDDYDHKRKTKRITAQVISSKPQKVFLTVTSGAGGTALYVDGKLVRRKSDMILRIPQGIRQRLVIGNSVHGNSSWKGECYGLAVYDQRLDGKTVESHFNTWSGNPLKLFSAAGKPFLSFAFNERQGMEARDPANRFLVLRIPAVFPVLEKEFVKPPWRDFGADMNYLADVVINLLGFIPLGFIVCALFLQRGGIASKKAVALSAVIGFLISLGIEIAQAWIPTRSSQGSDLLLNTIGAFIGAILCRRHAPSHNGTTGSEFVGRGLH